MCFSLCVGFIHQFLISVLLTDPDLWPGRLMSVILQFLGLSWILWVFSQLGVIWTFKCYLLISAFCLSHSIFTLSYRCPRSLQHGWPTGVSWWPEQLSGGHLPNVVFQVFSSPVKALSVSLQFCPSSCWWFYQNPQYWRPAADCFPPGLVIVWALSFMQ